jgi:tRNA-specific 2-thiouridylase
MNNAGSKVFVMLSGGVDSSVAAKKLVDQGYDVVGVFMKCWSLDQLKKMGVSEDLYGCFWEEDSKDASIVASSIGIPFYVWDFEDTYKQKVVDYMIGSYKIGLTPNPDVMCNSVIKFGVFYERAKKLGADFVATGHYARTVDYKGQKVISRGFDSFKDQSYFLWGIEKEIVNDILFPIGEFDSKASVREFAYKNNLITATKKDSQGLCFIGTTPLRELLLQTLGEKDGLIKDINGKILGTHKGAYLYTIGQRNGLSLSGGPWFVTKIDVEKNEVIVCHQDDVVSLDQDFAIINEPNFMVDVNNIIKNDDLVVQVRYNQNPSRAKIEKIEDKKYKIKFEKPVRAIAKGQSAVLYSEFGIMYGGGVIV